MLEKTSRGPAPILGLCLRSLRSMGLSMSQSSRAKTLYCVKVQELEQNPWSEVRIKPSPLWICALEMLLILWTLPFPGRDSSLSRPVPDPVLSQAQL